VTPDAERRGSPRPRRRQARPRQRGRAAPPRPLDLSRDQGLLSGADPGWRVALAVEQTVLKIGQDKLAFSVTSSLPGYLHVLMIDAENRRLRQIFPNSIDAEHRVEGGAARCAAAPGWSLAASGPPGAPTCWSWSRRRRATARWSDSRILKAVASMRPVPHRPGRPGGRAFAGLPVDCQFATATCDAYGAAVISVEEQPR
jgi:hypothetical protein